MTNFNRAQNINSLTKQYWVSKLTYQSHSNCRMRGLVSFLWRNFIHALVVWRNGHASERKLSHWIRLNIILYTIMKKWIRTNWQNKELTTYLSYTHVCLTTNYLSSLIFVSNNHRNCIVAVKDAVTMQCQFSICTSSPLYPVWCFIAGHRSPLLAWIAQIA